MAPPGTPRNDPTIPDSELLYRRILWNYVKEGKVCSPAFISRNKADPHVSVDLSSLTTPQETHQRWPEAAGVVQLIAGDVREITPGVARDPLEDNPAHALIIHDSSLSNSQQKEVARKLARLSVWAIAPKK